MSRPTKKEKQYRINEDIVNDIRNNPDKYRTHEERKSTDILKSKELQKFIEANKRMNNNKLALTSFKLLLETGLSPNITIPYIRGKEINPFHANLTNKQIDILYPFFNKLLQEAITLDDFRKLLDGDLSNTQYKVKKNRSVAILFKRLQENGYIDTDWQNTLEKLKTFASRNDKPLKASDYSKALIEIHDDNKGMRKELQEIEDLMQEVKKAGE